MSDRVQFTCNGREVVLDVDPAESLMTVLRERLGLGSVKDGCAPQGQCGCCTVLVDGSPRASCVTPIGRAAGRAIVTAEGLDSDVRDALAEAFVATGGSQCGFCTPGIVVRTAGLVAGGAPADAAIDRALAAHLCRCTGWLTVREAVATAAARAPARPRALDAAARRAELEGGVAQRVDDRVPLGDGSFADDRAPRDALVAVPCPPGDAPEGAIEAQGLWWSVAGSVHDARVAAGKVQGRRTTIGARPPLPVPPAPDGGVCLATSWVEPAYLEPDASWCAPAGAPASPLANGGAFGGKSDSLAPVVARELAVRLGQSVRVVYAREDVVRLGPKRPPIAATAVVRDGAVLVEGLVAGDPAPFVADGGGAVLRIPVERRWQRHDVPGLRSSTALRAVGLAETAVLVEAAIAVASIDRAEVLPDDPRARAVLLDTCVAAASGALAGARVDCDANGAVARVHVRVAAGDPLDATVLRSYAIGAAHMALGWVLTEALAVDPDTGEVLDLTIRSFGVIPAARTPAIEVTIVEDDGASLARASDAVFAAVAAAAWNAISRAEGVRPTWFPARETAASRALRR